MRYWSRQNVMQRLRLSQSASYRIIGTSRGKLISSTDLLAILNNSRRGPQPMLSEVPSDLLTEDEMSDELKCVTKKQLHSWTLRKANLPPYFHINAHCRRFQRSAVLSWLDTQTQIIKRG